MASLNLSRQEALLALQLASGEPLKKAAHAIAISYETARGYLKSIFAKTGCNNQLMLAFTIHDACLLQQHDALPTITRTNRATLTREIIMASFSLSQQEARLTLKIVSGISLKQAAYDIGISYESARGYLKSIYAKTGCSNQTTLALKVQNESLPATPDSTAQYPVSARIDAMFTLSNGRALSYCIYGPKDGYPVVVHHTICGSRMQIHHDIQMLDRHHIKIIIADRPGYGSSTYCEERNLHDWPPELEELLEHLGIASFAQIGIQYGAEYALACSQYFGERVVSTQLISMEAPPELLAEQTPLNHTCMQQNIRLNKRRNLSIKVLSNTFAVRVLQQATKFVTTIYAHHPQKLFQQVVMFNSVLDKKLLHHESFVQQALHAWQVAYAQTEGMMIVKDFQVHLQPWQVDFSSITQPVHIWHSRHDPQALFAPVKSLLHHFNDGVAELHVIEDDSVMTFYHHMEEIMAQLRHSLDTESKKPVLNLIGDSA